MLGVRSQSSRCVSTKVNCGHRDGKTHPRGFEPSSNIWAMGVCVCGGGGYVKEERCGEKSRKEKKKEIRKEDRNGWGKDKKEKRWFREQMFDRWGKKRRVRGDIEEMGREEVGEKTVSIRSFVRSFVS